MRIVPVTGLPEIAASDDLVDILLSAVESSLEEGDVVVVASKVVSRAEGRFVELSTVRPGDRARELASQVEGDPRMVELVLSESVAVSRAAPGALIVRHRLGHVCANGGVDRSNARPGGADGEWALLLPEDPDGWAAGFVRRALPRRVAVIVSDTVGRAFRQGATGLAVGVAGLAPLVDLCGRPDRHGRPMRHSAVAVADVLASAADLVMGQAAESTPAALIRGFDWSPPVGDAPVSVEGLHRAPDADLYA